MLSFSQIRPPRPQLYTNMHATKQRREVGRFKSDFFTRVNQTTAKQVTRTPAVAVAVGDPSCLKNPCCAIWKRDAEAAKRGGINGQRSGGRLPKKTAILTPKESSVCQNKPSLWRANHHDRRGDSSVFSLGCLSEGKSCIFLYDHYLVGTSWFPRKAINCPREVEKVLRWKGWTVFNLPVDSQWAPPKYEQLGRIFPILKSHSVKAPPPPCIFIYMARVAVQRISIFRLRVSFQAYIPNAVDHQRYAPPPSPLLAFMYTNTHLLGARPSGRELQRANLWSPGEGKGQGTQTGLTSLPPFTASETLGPRYGKRCFSFSNCIGLFNSFPEQTSQRGYLFS